MDYKDMKSYGLTERNAFDALHSLNEEKKKDAAEIEKAADWFMENLDRKMVIRTDNLDSFWIYKMELDRDNIIGALKKRNAVANMRSDIADDFLDMKIDLDGDTPNIREIGHDFMKVFTMCCFYNPYISPDFYRGMYGVNAEKVATKENPFVGCRILSDDEMFRIVRLVVGWNDAMKKAKRMGALFRCYVRGWKLI